MAGPDQDGGEQPGQARCIINTGHVLPDNKVQFVHSGLTWLPRFCPFRRIEILLYSDGQPGEPKW